MGIAKPSLKDIVHACQGQRPDKATFGKRRAIIQCFHESGRSTISEVRGAAVFDQFGLPHDLVQATWDVRAHCIKCGNTYVLDLAPIRAALRQHGGGAILKLDVAQIAR